MVRKSFVVAALVFSLVCLGQAAPQSDAPGMSLVPSGEFWMGRTHMFFWDEIRWIDRDRLDDQPARVVFLDAYYIDKYEVTDGDYQRFTEATSHRTPWHWPDGKVTSAQEKLPVYNVEIGRAHV